MTSHWAAVRADTDALTRARQLQRSWEHLLGDAALGPELPPGATVGLRPTIVESWRRSLATGLDPTDLLAPIEADEDEALERWLEHPLGSLSHILTHQLLKVAEESRSIVVVTDASGLVLHRLGDDWLKERAAEMNLVEGARYSEAADGTNGIGTALAADHPFEVFAFEHFNERHHEWVCAGAPVHDPVSGRIIGLIDLSSHWKSAHPRSLELVTATAGTIEQSLADARRDADARLRHRYSDFLRRSSDLLIDRDGYVLDGPTPAQPGLFDIPEGGGEVVMGDGSVSIVEPLGHGEAYLVRKAATRIVKSALAGASQRAGSRAHELATEQAALRKVATLVAREPSPDQLFAVVAEQAAWIFDVPYVRLVLYEPDGSVVVGGFSDGEDEPFPIGSRWSRDDPGVTATVRQTGRPARVDNYSQLPGEIAAVVRGAGMRSAVACPIVVDRRLWGAMVVLGARDEPFPEDTEARLTDFAELVATAIANVESRVALARLADEQAALRRIAVLVAQQPSPSDVFTAVTEAVGVLLDADLAVLHVFRGGGATTIASWAAEGPELPVGTRFPLDGDNLASRIFQTGAPARMHSEDEAWNREATDLARTMRVRSAVGAPILVQGKLWGALMAATRRVEPWAENDETRIAAFTELAATAIANAESREALARLADEQAALRHVATLVARGAPPQELFEAVAEEIGRLLHVASASLGRYETDDIMVTVASWGTSHAAISPGRRWPVEGKNVAWSVLRTGQPARIDDYSAATDPIGVSAREAGIKSAVGCPVVVNGRLWGFVTAASTEGPLPPGTEARLTSFTELVATAIANAEGSAELAASRRRIVAASDEARRRIERDLHDGVQQQLVSLGLELGAMHADPPSGDALKAQLASATDEVRSVLDALVELARGIHPAILSRGGLAAALRVLARRSPVPVELHAQIDGPLPGDVEVAAYYVAAEALTNAAKHARATVVHIDATTAGATLTLTIADDGVGGATPGGGSGLVGLQDRVAALGGTITLESAAGHGTCVVVALPIAPAQAPELDPPATRRMR